MDTATLRFDTARHRVRPLRADEVPRLQALYEANPGYFVTVDGRPPQPDGAQTDFDERPPAHLPWREQHIAGVFDAQGALVGVLIVTTHLVAEGVWHIALFLIATALHGSGTAQQVYDGLEAWCRAAGARWLRLGVVVGNHRAERFWARQGYTELRTRPMVNGVGETRTTRVMLKPLGDDTADDYLARVPRDRADSTLP